MSLDLQPLLSAEPKSETPPQFQRPGPAISVAARWLPVAAVAFIGWVLLPRLFDYAQHSLDVVRFPWQLDFDEGINLNASWLLSQGVNIYRPNPPDHFISSMYPPLYFVLNAAAIKVFGLGLTSGRLLALAGALGVGVVLWAWVYAETRRHIAGVLAALLWFSLGPVYVWSSFYKQDMLALALGMIGCVMIVWSQVPSPQAKTQNSKLKTQNFAYWAIVPLALSFWTKQSSLAPMAAVGLFLLMGNVRIGVRWALAAGGSIVVPFAAIDLLLKGGLHTHVFAFDYYGRSTDRLIKNMQALWVHHAPLVICGLAFALFAMWASLRQKQRSPLSVLYLLVSIPAVLLSNSLPTANYNHLLDILAPLCLMLGVGVGAALRGLEGRTKAAWALAAVGALALAFTQAIMLSNSNPAQWYTPVGMPLNERAARMERLSAVVAQTPGDMLSEDNLLLLKNGKRVLYDDPAAMAALGNAGAWDQSTLLDDIKRHKFSLIILQYDLTDQTYNSRWSNVALAALKANYEIQYRDVLFAHTPRPAPSAPETVTGCTVQNGPILAGCTFRSTTVNRGDNLPLSLYWQNGSPNSNPNLQFFVRLVDQNGAAKWSADLPPGATAHKLWSDGWASGEAVRDDITLPVAQDLPYGRYRLQFGAYTTGQNNAITPLAVTCEGNLTREADGSMTLANIEVVERWGK